MLVSAEVFWLLLCAAHAWWDAFFGIDHFNRAGISFKGQHFLGGWLSIFWLGFYLLLFNFSLKLGWLLVGLVIAGQGAIVLRYLLSVFTHEKLNPQVVEWWFNLHLPIRKMSLLNLLLLVLGLCFVILGV